MIRWLDFGCGLGGLVRYGQSSSAYDVRGFDEGSRRRRDRPGRWGAVTVDAEALG